MLGDLDLYALVLAGAIFTVLGVSGIADVEALSSVILALLTLLAFSQVRTRQQMSATARTGSDIFLRDFPKDLYDRRSSAQDEYLYIGTSGHRTIATGRRDFESMLKRGARVRFLLMDSSNQDLLRLAAARAATAVNVNRLKDRIDDSIGELEDIGKVAGGGLQVRLLPLLPSFGLNGFDMSERNGTLYVQHFEHGAEGEPAPIFRLEAREGYWYDHYLAECERLWDAGRPISPP